MGIRVGVESEDGRAIKSDIAFPFAVSRRDSPIKGPVTLSGRRVLFEAGSQIDGSDDSDGGYIRFGAALPIHVFPNGGPQEIKATFSPFIFTITAVSSREIWRERAEISSRPPQ